MGFIHGGIFQENYIYFKKLEPDTKPIVIYISALSQFQVFKHGFLLYSFTFGLKKKYTKNYFPKNIYFISGISHDYN